jgi:FMN phosphatase YigB (HAD superfamily)
LFDEVVLSFEERMLKPEKALFMKVVGTAKNYVKSPILFVDDNEDYVREAKELGMLGFVYRSYPHFAFWLRTMGLYVP